MSCSCNNRLPTNSNSSSSSKSSGTKSYSNSNNNSNGNSLNNKNNCGNNCGNYCSRTSRVGYSSNPAYSANYLSSFGNFQVSSWKTYNSYGSCGC